MSQESRIEISELLKILEKEVLTSSLEFQSVELELKVITIKENGETKIYVLDSNSDSEINWSSSHTLKVKVFKDSGDPPGGFRAGTKPQAPDKDPGDPPGG